MARGRHMLKSAHAGGSSRLLVLCLVLLLVASVGGTLAYVVVRSGAEKNTFQPAQVTSEVVVGNGTRAVKNTGDVPAYIRAAVTVNWVSTDSGSNTTRGIAPTESDYSLKLNTGDSGAWIAHTDGYYYYEYKVEAKAVTATLVENIQCSATPPAGYALAVEVAAEAIQADGDTDVGGIPAYKSAWGSDVPTLPGGGQ